MAHRVPLSLAQLLSRKREHARPAVEAALRLATQSPGPQGQSCSQAEPSGTPARLHALCARSSPTCAALQPPPNTQRLLRSTKAFPPVGGSGAVHEPLDEGHHLLSVRLHSKVKGCEPLAVQCCQIRRRRLQQQARDVGGVRGRSPGQRGAAAGGVDGAHVGAPASRSGGGARLGSMPGPRRELVAARAGCALIPAEHRLCIKACAPECVHASGPWSKQAQQQASLQGGALRSPAQQRLRHGQVPKEGCSHERGHALPAPRLVHHRTSLRGRTREGQSLGGGAEGVRGRPAGARQKASRVEPTPYSLQLASPG